MRPRRALLRFLQRSLLGCGALALLGDSADAALIEVDLLSPGDRLVTRDTDSGLDWLDLGLTRSLSFRDVEDGAGGWVDQGWRHASTDELCGLLAQIGSLAPTPCPGDGPLGELADFAPYTELLGSTREVGTGSDRTAAFAALFDDGVGDVILVGRAVLSLRTDGTTQLTVRPVNTFRTLRSGELGHFLVRRVPEPAAIGFLAAALAWGHLARRERRAANG